MEQVNTTNQFEGKAVLVTGANSGLGFDAAGRHVTGFKKFLFTKVMPTIGCAIGNTQPRWKGAKHYVDVLNGTDGDFVNGKTYTSQKKKLVGPLYEMTYDHLLHEERQEFAWTVLGELTGTGSETAAKYSGAN